MGKHSDGDGGRPKGRPAVATSYCRYCGNQVADKWLARHLKTCPENPANKK
jgi:hypothetical protein